MNKSIRKTWLMATVYVRERKAPSPESEELCRRLTSERDPLGFSRSSSTGQAQEVFLALGRSHLWLSTQGCLEQGRGALRSRAAGSSAPVLEASSRWTQGRPNPHPALGEWPKGPKMERALRLESFAPGSAGCTNKSSL